LIQINDPYGNQLNFGYTGNNLTSVTDNLSITGRNGLTLTYNTDTPVNHLTGISDWSRRQWIYSYINPSKTVYSTNSSSTNYYGIELAGVNSPLGGYRTYQYLPGHLLWYFWKPLTRYNSQTFSVLPVGTTFQYYQNGRAFNDQDGLGDTETLSYDLYRLSSKVTDPNGGVREYDYDSNGALIKLIQPDGGQLFFSNQSDGLRYQKYDALGYGTQYSYNAANTFNTASNNGGNVSLEQDALTNTITTTYGSYDQVATVKDKRGNTTTISYYTSTGKLTGGCDLAGKPQSVTLSNLSSVSLSNVNSVITSTTSKQANVTLRSYCWNADGTLSSLIEYPNATGTTHPRTTTYSYDTAAHLNVSAVNVTGKDINGNSLNMQTSYTYDALGRKLSETLTRTGYVTPLTSTAATASQSLTTGYQYDAFDRVIKVTTADGLIHQTVYDLNDQIYQQITWYPSTTARTGCTADSSGVYQVCIEATHQYDAADRRISTTDLLNNVTQFAYDANSNLIQITDANQHTTQYQYDAMNRRTAVINGNGQTTTTTYDQAGHATAVIDANGQTTTSTYDKLGRLTQITDPLGNQTQYSYDANGNMICRLDANALSTSVTPGHQPENTDGCTESRTYDELNRLIQSTDANNYYTAYTLNLYGSPLSVTDAAGNVTAYLYDDLGRLNQSTDPLGHSQSYIPDEAGNVRQQTDRKGQVTLVAYDAMNRTIQTLHNADGSSESYM
jgi:YD repeat-containing protein